MDNLKYNMRGVSAAKEDVHNAIKNIDKGLYPKAFCKILPDILGGDPAFCNIMHADGAGTKSSLAYLYWKETGDMSVWKGVAVDAVEQLRLLAIQFKQIIIDGAEPFANMCRSFIKPFRKPFHGESPILAIVIIGIPILAYFYQVFNDVVIRLVSTRK